MPELPFKIPRTHAEKAVLGALRQSKDGKGGRAMHVRALASVLGMNERLVRLCVSNLRKMGEPIISNQKGYWLARSQDDIDRCVKSLHRRALEILTVMSRLKQNSVYAEMARQLRLPMEETSDENKPCH